MALRTAGSVLVVFLWSVAVILCQNSSIVTYTKNSICTLKGSTVDLSCSYTYPRGQTVTTTTWYKWKSLTWTYIQDKYVDRIEYRGNKENDCTLRITDLREEDSASYYFSFTTGSWTFGSDVTLSVTDLKVTGGMWTRGEYWMTLTCSTTCTLTDNTTYIWYKNGQHLDEPTSHQYSVNSYYSDSYSCAVKGHEDLLSPAVCVVGESCMNVTYTHQSICALKGSTVDISCFYTHPSWHNVTEVSWFNKWESGVTKDLSLNPDYADRVEYHRQTENDSTLRITDLRESDSTEYKFRFTTDEARWGYSFHGTTLTVTGFQVKVTPDQFSEYKTLTCSTTCTLTDNPTYIWYKNGQHLDESTSPQYKDSVSSNYEDSYSCAVKGHENLHSPAVCVWGQSCYRVTYTNRIICVLKGSTVDISCTYVGYYSTTSSFWFRSDKSTPEDLTTGPGYAGRVKYTGTYKGPFTLRITDLREEDSAEYRFTFKANNFEWGHSFPGTTLSVTGLQVKVTPAAEGQKTLTCITTCTLTDNPTYIWYKNGQRLDEPTSQQYSSNTLVVLGHSADSYSCTVEHHEDLHSPAVYGPKNTSVSVSPSGEIVEGSSVTLTCSSDANPPVDKYTWYKKNVTSPKASGQSYSITNILSEDRGEYYCEAQNGRGSMNSTALMIIVAGKQTSVMTAAVGIIVVVLVLILCFSGFMWFRRSTGGSDATADTQSVHPDPNSDTYTPLNMKTRSPEYDTLANVRGISH